VAAMVAATALWGATFVVIRDILPAIGPFELIFTRFALSAALLAIARSLRPRAIDREALAAGVLAGLFAAGGFLFQAIGLTRTSAGSSAFLTCTGTVFAAFFAWPLLGQRPSAALLQGIVLALGGSALLSSRLGAFGPGEAWTLLGALCYALQIIVIARTASRVHPVSLAGLQSLTVALVLLPFARHAPARVVALGPVGLARLAYLVIAGTVLAPLLQIAAQRVLAAGRVALLFALEPVFALGFAFGLGGERFGLRWCVGAALILAGVLRVEWRAARSRAPSPDGATPGTA
jgi:drug/metabolite transporter (DMT)-like permease